MAPNQIRRVGHKGADLIAPGNTFASFDAALEAGVDMIEFDVLPSRDGRLLLAHDYQDAARRSPHTLEEGLAHLAGEFDSGLFLRRLRGDDQTRRIGDALLDQRNAAGIGNIWKAEGCWEAGVDPWRALDELSDAEALAIVEGMRPRMLRSALDGPRTIQPRVYGKARQPCSRCGERILARRQGEDNRTTYWCPGCQR